MLFGISRESAVVVHAFVLMSNHTHLLLQPKQPGFSSFIQRLNVTYAKFANRRYQRIGHLFQGRFHSSHVDKDQYFLVTSRYVHNNPVRAGMVREAVDYPWSSARAFIGDLDEGSSLDRLISRMVETQFTLNLFGSEIGRQQAAYRDFLVSVSDTEDSFKKKIVL
jgi:REP element-mobilizing transposase RayT